MIKVPGLTLIKNYKTEWFSKDLVAGLSVAAIAMPVGIAYAGITGLPVQTGLYSCILPMIAYAMFGSSKQLIVGPDSATCLLVASSIAPLAAVGSAEYNSLSVFLALIVGVLCILFGALRFDFIANFLSKPILNGYLNGLAISIIAGQLGKVFGYDIKTSGLLRMMDQFFSQINETHFTTLTIGAGAFAMLRIFKRFIPKIPAPLFVVIAGIAVVYFMGLDKEGVRIVGSIPAGLPEFGIPDVDLGSAGELVMDALGIVLISYCSFMLTNKSFAAKNRYDIDANQDFYALGIANISSGLSQGFAISGADSRTAVVDSAGGKTQIASVVGAVTMIMILLFLTSPLEYLPIPVLGAIVISASIGLFNFEYLKVLYKVNREEFILAIITSLCVISIGVLPAVIVAVGLAMLRLITRSSHPHDAVLGKIQGSDSYHDILEYPEAETIEGVLIYRYDSSMLFYNADYFKKRLRELTGEEENLKCVILNLESVVYMDITSADVFSDVVKELNEKNITVLAARSKSQVKGMMVLTGLENKVKLFDSVRSAVKHYNESLIQKSFTLT